MSLNHFLKWIFVGHGVGGVGFLDHTIPFEMRSFFFLNENILGSRTSL
jgi:hypothetical protein